MDVVAEMRRRLQAARERLGRHDRAQAETAERVQAALAQLDGALARRRAEVDRLERENQELRALLLDSVSLSLDVAERDDLGSALRQLDMRLRALGDDAPAPARPPAEPPTAPRAVPQAVPQAMPRSVPAEGADELFRAALTGDDAMAAALARIHELTRKRGEGAG